MGAHSNKAAVDRFGRIDVLVNNAGIMPTAPLSERRFDDWCNMLDINIMGILHGIAAVLPIMKKQQSGQIVTTNSVAGHVVYEGSSVYCGTKFAVRTIMEGLRQEEWENNIRSIIISPGAVLTELYKTTNDPAFIELVENNPPAADFALKSSDIADAVSYAIGTPETVVVSEILIRPTKQVI